MLVTGAAGFVGAALEAVALADGARVVGVGRRGLDRPGYHALDLAAGPGPLAALLAAERPSAIFHLAGGPAPDPWAANVLPLRNLLAAIRAVPGLAPRVVVLGSAAEYGDLGPAPIEESARENPVSEYGVAKLAETRLAVVARRAGLPVVVARAFNVLGPGMPLGLAAARFASEALRARAEGRDGFTVGDLSTVRDYVEVEDVARALWALARAPDDAPIVNVCSGVGVRTGEVLAEILRQVGGGLEARVDPGLVGGPGDVRVSVGSQALLRRLTGLAPRFSVPGAVARLLAASAATR